MSDGGAAGGQVGAALREALAGLAGRSPLLVALDFDGVVAPIVERAGEARALPASAEAVERLAALDGVTVALVSGRSLASLREVSGPPEGAVLVGSHGAEAEGLPTGLSPEQTDLLARVTDAVADVVEAHPGTELEHKPAGAVLHTRRASRETAAAAAEEVLDGPAGWEGVESKPGKEVVELSVVDADKGTALVALRDRLAERAGGRPVVLFAGDDVTDEDAFRVLDAAAGDVGVKVGPGETAAGFRVDTPEAVSALLQDLVSALTAPRR